MSLMKRKTVRTTLLALLLVCILIGVIWQINRESNPAIVTAGDYKNITYTIEGTNITLVNGLATSPAAPGSATNVVTKYFGDNAVGDINGDGIDDVAFILTQDNGGSGTFYYVVAAIGNGRGYSGTNAVLLGDRIAPQSVEIRGGEVIANYADRAPGEPMTKPPSVGISKHFKVSTGLLSQVEN